MDFRIHDVTIHLMPQPADAPCTVLSGGPGEGPCDQPSQRPCQGKSGRPQDKPGDKDKPPGGKKRSLAFLQAQLRKRLSAPPL